MTAIFSHDSRSITDETTPTKPLAGIQGQSGFGSFERREDVGADSGAQFLKRVCFSDYRGCATSEAEAYHMIDASEHIRRALAEQGYAPR